MRIQQIVLRAVPGTVSSPSVSATTIMMVIGPQALSGQLFSHSVMVRLFESPWTAACQASLSFTISRSLLKLTSIESVMPSNHLILCHFLLLLLSIFPASGSLTTIQLFTSGGQSIAALASVLPMNIQG